MVRAVVLASLIVGIATGAAARELTWIYVVPAAANTTGVNGTDWHTDLTLYNPQGSELPVVVQFLRSGRDNSGGVPTVELDLAPWETVNLWDVLGPHGFDVRGQIGALFVYADDQRIQCSGTSCDLAVFSRTYTLDPKGGVGEFGQALPGFPADLGLDGSVIGYLPQILDDDSFRTNLGVASWSDDWVKVRTDLQDPLGNVIDRRDHLLPPFGHLQWRLERGVTGGTVAVYIADGPSDAVIYPYASVVNWATGDPVYVEAHLTSVGLTAQAAAVQRALTRPKALPVTGFNLGKLRQRPW